MQLLFIILDKVLNNKVKKDNYAVKSYNVNSKLLPTKYEDSFVTTNYCDKNMLDLYLYINDKRFIFNV